MNRGIGIEFTGGAGVSLLVELVSEGVIEELAVHGLSLNLGGRRHRRWLWPRLNPPLIEGGRS